MHRRDTRRLKVFNEFMRIKGDGGHGANYSLLAHGHSNHFFLAKTLTCAR
jgi:hypothetical protein